MLPGHPIILFKTNEFNMAALSVKRSIGHLHISHNTPRLPPKFCITFFSNSPGYSIAVFQGEAEDDAYAIFGVQTRCIMREVPMWSQIDLD